MFELPALTRVGIETIAPTAVAMPLANGGILPAMQGSVKWFGQRGYGYIAVDGELDYYFHISEVRAVAPPNCGDLVSFHVGQGRNGKPCAVNVVILEKADLNKKPYFGKPTYRKEGSSLAAAGVLGLLGAAVGGPVGGVVGAALGAVFGQPREVEITGTCLKCGGIGQVTARAEGFIGFQCKTCRSYWRKRDSS